MSRCALLLLEQPRPTPLYRAIDSDVHVRATAEQARVDADRDGEHVRLLDDEEDEEDEEAMHAAEAARAEALRLAAEEGLTLKRNEQSSTGFVGVHVRQGVRKSRKSYTAQM